MALQVVVELVQRDAPTGAREERPHQGAHERQVRDAAALDDVAEEHDVRVVAQDALAGGQIGVDRVGQAAFVQITDQMAHQDVAGGLPVGGATGRS